MKPITDEMKILNSEIKALEKDLADKKKAYQQMEEDAKSTIGITYAGMNIKTRKASYVITRPDGLSVTTPRKTNSHNERHVYWYNGKKGELALEFARMSPKKVALWLRDYS